ncbi:MAG: DUF4279 domain-containing protein [Myxococcota bacterium]
MARAQSRLTPYNDAYPTCERTSAKLLIYPGSARTPSQITKSLGIEPTEAVSLGESATNSLGISRTAKSARWSLDSEGHVSSLDLRRHLDWLLDRLEPSSKELLELQWHRGVGMAVDCIWWSRGGQGGPTLWPEQMLRLANLNLECGFSLAFFGEDEVPMGPTLDRG